MLSFSIGDTQFLSHPGDNTHGNTQSPANPCFSQSHRRNSHSESLPPVDPPQNPLARTQPFTKELFSFWSIAFQPFLWHFLPLCKSVDRILWDYTSLFRLVFSWLGFNLCNVLSHDLVLWPSFPVNDGVMRVDSALPSPPTSLSSGY